jgi:hypothetical protein
MNVSVMTPIVIADAMLKYAREIPTIISCKISGRKLKKISSVILSIELDPLPSREMSDPVL